MLMMLGFCWRLAARAKNFPADANDAGFVFAARGKSFQLMLMMLGVRAGG